MADITEIKVGDTVTFEARGKYSSIITAVVVGIRQTNCGAMVDTEDGEGKARATRAGACTIVKAAA